MDIRRIILQLSLINGVGPVTIKKIIESFGAGLTDIVLLDAIQLTQRVNLSSVVASKIVNGLSDSSYSEREIALAHRQGFNWLTVVDDEYPEGLKALHAPPPVIYIWGKLQQSMDHSISIVGSRQADTYAQDFIDEIVPGLCAASWCIVSGGALGADAMVHQRVISCNGITVAVLGSGLLTLYPFQNKRLFHEIVEKGGAVISPFPLQMPPQAQNFPARNRLIAGLSRATLVVQAAEKSGALITAAYALEEGRDVAAVPGNVRHPLSAGCHKLLRAGAALVGGVADLFEFLQAEPLVGDAPFKVQITEKKLQDAVSENACPVLKLCKEPQDFDELMLQTGLSYDELYQKLMLMQLDGLIRQDFMGRWHVAE